MYRKSNMETYITICKIDSQWKFAVWLLLLLSRFSRVRLCATPQTAAHQAPLFLGFSRQEHWSGLPFPFPMRESESEVAQSSPTLSNPMDCSPPGSSIHRIFQARRVLEWRAIAFSDACYHNTIQSLGRKPCKSPHNSCCTRRSELVTVYVLIIIDRLSSKHASPTQHLSHQNSLFTFTYFLKRVSYVNSLAPDSDREICREEVYQGGLLGTMGVSKKEAGLSRGKS